LNGYERRKLQKKSAIKKAAFVLFQKLGVKEIKIEDIANAAGVSQVTIYNHFGSKEALFREVIKDYALEQFEFHKSLIEKDISFHEKMKTIIIHKTNQLDNLHPSLLNEMMIHDEELKMWIEEFTMKYTAPLTMKLIKDAQETGEINPELSEQAILLYIQLFNNENLVTAITGSGGRKLIGEVFQMFFYGLSKPQDNI
jgi:AcrR family transcriptional regulator